MVIPTFFTDLSPIMQALLAGLFTWLVTAAGAAIVFTDRGFNQKVLDWMLGFAGGVMVAASFFSLLLPAIDYSEQQGVPGWIPAAIGFVIGAAFTWLIDQLIPHIQSFGHDTQDQEGLSVTWERSILLITAITVHNIPEGLAIGVAFGAVAEGLDVASMTAAVTLAIGIGLQNFPEGIAVAMPLRRENVSRRRSFFFGQLSAFVEPVFAVIGAAAVTYARPILPYALAFAAGAMIYVVVEEVVPESQAEGNTDLATLGVIVGLTVMMTLDVALG